jgi:hypothetical protein
MAVIANFGVPTQDAQGTTLMPKLQYRFRVTFTNMGGTSGHDTVTQNVVSVGRPTLSHEEIVVDSYNSKMYLAGKHTWEAVQLILRDDMNSNVIKQIGAQLNRQVDHADQSSSTAGAAYKFSMEIETLDGNNGEGNTPGVFDKWVLQGCYLSNVAYGELNYATSDMVQVTVTVRYDHAQHIIETDGGIDALSNSDRAAGADGATGNGTAAGA